MSEVTCQPDYPSIIEVEGAGRVEYMEFEETIWIMDVFCEKRGKGNKLAREFIEYARNTGKTIYGQANPQDHHSSMDLQRLKRWYHLLGAVPVTMEDHPHAMRLEI